jgi:glutamate-1-semialdehyde 2,1-aminomutase
VASTRRSKALFSRARRRIPGGVNSPVRAFGAVGAVPRFLVRGKGARVWDADGNAYIDYVLSWGPLILGHAEPRVVRAVRAAAARGTSFGAPTERETELADALCQALPGLERVRLVSSGTEAAMSALRLARAATGRVRIVKFDGCYHGHADALLVAAGSGVATLGIPGSPGVPSVVSELTVQAPYNDLDAVGSAFERWGGEIAGVIVEPVAGNMGFVLPQPGFLEGLRSLCDRHSALLIFDEVMTGFRVAWGGAQTRFGVRPDLTCLGKVVGGGLPAAAYGGRADLMTQVAPEGPVYQAGTLSGNPLAVAAGLETLRQLRRPGVYEQLEACSLALVAGLRGAADETGVELVAESLGGMFGFFFHPGPVRNFEEAKKASAPRFRAFFRAMLEQGIYLAPSPFEAGFVSLAHRPSDLRKTVAAARVALRAASQVR